MTPAGAFPPLDLSRVPVPPRSRLYRLAPAGGDTALRESVLSYLVRLANKHHVTVGVLLAEGLPGLIASSGGQDGEPSAVLRNARSAMGTELLAGRWAAALGEATLIPAPERMSFLPWAPVVPAFGLIGSPGGHCAACLDEMLASGTVWEPLLWSVRVVSACPVHGTRLRRACPACGGAPSIHRVPLRPGLCARCGAWLGAPGAGPEPADPEAVSLAAEVGRLIAGPPTRPPEPGGPARAFELAIARLGGSQRAFSALTGLRASAVSEWRRGLGRPSITAVARAAAVGGWSLREFLLGSLVEAEAPWSFTLARAPRAERSWPAIGRRIDRWRQVQPEPPSISQIERAFGLARRTLRSQLPDLAADVVERRAASRAAIAAARRDEAVAAVVRAVDELAAQGHSASRRQVEARLPEPLSLRERPLQEAWRLRRHELGILPERHR